MNLPASSPYGRLLSTGLIVQFRSPDIDFDEALKAGPDHMTEYFSRVLGGLRVGHVEELRKLGLFAAIKGQTGYDVDLGSWNAIPAEDLDAIAQVVERMIPEATQGMRNLLDDLHEMLNAAKADGCSIGFMLND